MEHKLNSLILLPIFVILLVVIFRTIKNSFNIDVFKSVLLSVAVSVLATVALNSAPNGTVGVVLLPYAALAVCILVAVLVAFLFKTRKKARDRFSEIIEKSRSELKEKRKHQINDHIVKRYTDCRK